MHSFEGVHLYCWWVGVRWVGLVLSGVEYGGGRKRGRASAEYGGRRAARFALGFAMSHEKAGELQAESPLRATLRHPDPGPGPPPITAHRAPPESTPVQHTPLGL